MRLYIYIIIFFLFILTFSISCTNDIEKVKLVTQETVLPTFSVNNLETNYSDSGIVKVKIMAPELVRYEKKNPPYDEYSKGFNVEFYNSNNQISATLSCRYAKYNINEEIWEAKSNVEVNNLSEHEKINTELLYWDMKQENIYSDKFVRITTAEEILFGEGFESKQDFSKWKIIKPTGSIQIKNE